MNNNDITKKNQMLRHILLIHLTLTLKYLRDLDMGIKGILRSILEVPKSLNFFSEIPYQEKHYYVNHK